MAFADTQKLVVQIDLAGNIQSGIRSTVKGLRDLDKMSSRTQRSLGKFGRNLEVGALALVGVGGLLVKSAADYEDAFAGVRKTVDATGPELEKLSSQFRALSKEIPISAAELARLGEAGGALGVPVKDLEEFVRVTALLGVTTDLTADQAAESLGILSNVLHLTGDEYDNFASSLVALGNAGASTESQIIEIAQRAGASGELVGFASDQVLGFASSIASLGIEAEAGGTALQRFLIDSAKHVAAGGDELKLFAKIARKSTKQFRKDFEANAGAALTDFLKGLGKLDAAAQFNVLDQLGFGDSRITRTLLGLANNTELLTDQLGIAQQAFKDGNALTTEADKRFATFNSQLQITKNILTDVGITIGSKLLPKLTPLLKRLNDFITGHQADIEKFGEQLAGAFEKFADAVGKTDWTPFIDGLKLSADLAKGAFDAFNALPDDFKKLVLVGFGINKFTGGLISSIGKDVAGALGAQFLSRGSSPANPLWVQSVGGGAGVDPLDPTGPSSGGLRNIVKKVLDVAAVLIPPVLVASAVQPAINDTLLPNNPLDPKNFLPPDNGDVKPFWELLLQSKPPQFNDKFKGDSETATRQNITNERLEAIRANTQAHNAKADLLNSKMDNQVSAERSINAAIAQLKLSETQTATNTLRSSERLESIRQRAAAEQSLATSTLRSSERQEAIANQAKQAIRDTRAETAAVRAAVNAKKLSVTTNVNVNTAVSVRETIVKNNTYKKYYSVAS